MQKVLLLQNSGPSVLSIPVDTLFPFRSDECPLLRNTRCVTLLVQLLVQHTPAPQSPLIPLSCFDLRAHHKHLLPPLSSPSLLLVVLLSCYRRL